MYCARGTKSISYTISSVQHFVMMRLWGSVRPLQARRTFSASAAPRTYEQQLHNAVENVSALLEQSDRLSYLLAQYVPEPARPAFLAVRAFGLEVNKIAAQGSRTTSMGVSTSDLKFKFWSDLVEKAFAGREVGEPAAFLLRDALDKGLNLDMAHFHTFLQTRKHFLSSQFATTADIGAYGEGTYSQLHYAAQGLLLLPPISPSAIALMEASPTLQKLVGDVAAHLGHASGVSSMLLGLTYYAQQNRVTVPVDLMAKADLSQEALLRLAQGHLDPLELQVAREKLQNVVFDTAVYANDHLLLARQKLAQLVPEIAEVAAAEGLAQRKRWRRGIPDAVFVPFMAATPTALYLQRLEKHDFDVLSPKIQQKEWRLAWASFKSYHRRTI